MTSLAELIANLRAVWRSRISQTVPLHAAPTASSALPIAVYTLISQEPRYKDDFMAQVHMQIAVYTRELNELLSVQHAILWQFGGQGVNIGETENGDTVYCRLVAQRPAVYVEESESWQGVNELEFTYLVRKA